MIHPIPTSEGLFSGYLQITLTLGVILLTAWFAVLFLQSGFDKVFDHQGNLGWLKDHFGKSPLRGMVRQMLVTVTLLEVVAGLLCASGIVYFLITHKTHVCFWGFALGNFDLLMLFFGQRIAKEYVGAADLQPYFTVGIIGMLLTGLIAA